LHINNGRPRAEVKSIRAEGVGGERRLCYDARVTARSAETKRRVAAVARRLVKEYGPVRRKRRPPFDELVQTVLSQNTTDVNSARTFASLKERFPRPEELATADVRAVAASIRLGGLERVKARYLKEITREVLKRRGNTDLSFLNKTGDGEAEAWLTSLPGVGAKTARVVLLFSFGRDVFPVDTHILRLTKRLGLIGAKATAAAAHEFWDEYCPPGKARELHLGLIRHGREVCAARRPACDACVLADLCPSRGTFE
jgi:endonuclease-3